MRSRIRGYSGYAIRVRMYVGGYIVIKISTPSVSQYKYSIIFYIYIDVNKSRHIYLFRFIKININIRNVRILHCETDEGYYRSKLEIHPLNV